jgi:hypothetical protein
MEARLWAGAIAILLKEFTSRTLLVDEFISRKLLLN